MGDCSLMTLGLLFDDRMFLAVKGGCESRPALECVVEGALLSVSQQVGNFRHG